MDHVPSQFEHDANDGNGRRALTGKRGLLAALALLGVIGFTALGIWQVERRAWKLDLIARVDARIHAAPAPVGDLLDCQTRANSKTLVNPAKAGTHLERSRSPEMGPRLRGNDEEKGQRDCTSADVEYRRVRLNGTFLHDRETLVQALTDRGAGFWVVTPLRTAAGTVLVNRGFVPEDHRDPVTRPARPTPATVIGLIRTSEPGGGFLRANDPAANRWYSRDVAAIARAQHLGATAPFFVDADDAPNPGGYPIGGLTVIRFNNNHLIYALTWFGLALLCAGAAVAVLREPRRG